MAMVDGSMLFCGILMNFLLEVATAMGSVNDHIREYGINFNWCAFQRISKAQDTSHTTGLVSVTTHNYADDSLNNNLHDLKEFVQIKDRKRWMNLLENRKKTILHLLLQYLNSKSPY